MAIKGERGEPWRNSRKFGIETASTGRKRERRERREFSNRRRTKIICGIRFPRGNRVSIGSCEIPGVLTRAIYHARSVFAYVVKGLCVAYYALGHIGVVECLFKFACLRILHARTHTPLLSLSCSSLHGYLRISLFQLPRLCLATLVAKNPRRLSSSSSERIFHPSHLTLFPAYRGSPSRSFVTLVYSKRLLPAFPPFPPVTCESSKVIESSSGVQFLNRETNPCFSGEGVSFVVRGKRCAIYEARYIYIYVWIYRRSSWKRNLIPQSDEGSPWLDTSFQLS